MKKLAYISVCTLALSLLNGCNSTSIDAQEPQLSASNNSPYRSVHVFNNRAELPKNTKILGKVTALNTNPNGTKASSAAIIDELKRQALRKGGNGIVFVTPGASQTTANAVLVRDVLVR